MWVRIIEPARRAEECAVAVGEERRRGGCVVADLMTGQLGRTDKEWRARAVAERQVTGGSSETRDWIWTELDSATQKKKKKRGRDQKQGGEKALCDAARCDADVDGMVGAESVQKWIGWSEMELLPVAGGSARVGTRRKCRGGIWK